jgi:hypothetical protein
MTRARVSRARAGWNARMRAVDICARRLTMRSWRCARGVGVAESDRCHARCVREKGHVCALEVDDGGVTVAVGAFTRPSVALETFDAY